MPTLSVAMIVKNEAQDLAQCLETVKGWVDEIVILDSGSQDKVEKVVAPQPRQVAHREAVRPGHTHSYDRNFDLAETAEIPVLSQRRPETPKASAFGDWDLRRDSIVRQGESAVSPVERFESPSTDEDELETPPFFKNR